MEDEQTQEQAVLQSCPSCATLIDVSDEEPFSQVHCPICGQAMKARTQFHNFELLDVLGRGGMGAVYKARDLNLNRFVALKVIRKEHCQSEEFIAKFETEARITASVNHPYVVKVFSFGQDHGQFYIAMELVDKGSLDSLINLQGRVAEAQVLEVGIQIAQGLRAASNVGLIHRDVKPGNILFADAHTAKIVDFGLALLMEEEAAARGEVWGTPYYVAPEKLNAEPEDFRSDIYSLGGTLFHALAGRPPFDAETASMVALKHMKSRAVSLQAFAPGISSPTAYVINRMLDKDPNNRYQSYDELIEHLTYARTQLLEAAGRPKAQQTRVVVEAEETQKLMGWILLGILVLLIAAGGLIFAYRGVIFGGARNARELRELTRREQAQRQAAEEGREQFNEARQQILRGDYASATQALHTLRKNNAIKQPLRHWITMNEGLGLLLEGRRADANELFRQINGLYSSDEKELKMADFFLRTGQMMLDPESVAPVYQQNFAANTHEAFAFLLFAIKDWNLSQFDDALGFFNAYITSTVKPPYGWVMEYKPVAENFAADCRAVVEIQRMAAKAGTSAEKGAALSALRKARGELKIGGKANEALIKLEMELQRGAGSAQADEERKAAEQKQADTKVVGDAGQRFATLCAEYRFADARAEVEKTRPSDPAAARDRDAMLQKAGWLLGFQRRLISDINQLGSRVPVTLKSSQVFRDGVAHASEKCLQSRSQYGAVDVPWASVTPGTVFAIAQDFIRRMPNDSLAVERKWLAGVFGTTVANVPEGRMLLVEASQVREDYREKLEVFFPSAN